MLCGAHIWPGFPRVFFKDFCPPAAFPTLTRFSWNSFVGHHGKGIVDTLNLGAGGVGGGANIELGGGGRASIELGGGGRGAAVATSPHVRNGSVSAPLQMKHPILCSVGPIFGLDFHVFFQGFLPSGGVSYSYVQLEQLR